MDGFGQEALRDEARLLRQLLDHYLGAQPEEEEEAAPAPAPPGWEDTP